MLEPSAGKRTMKFKKQDIHYIFSLSLISSNFDNIKDIEIGNVDLEEFLKRVKEPP